MSQDEVRNGAELLAQPTNAVSNEKELTEVEEPTNKPIEDKFDNVDLDTKNASKEDQDEKSAAEKESSDDEDVEQKEERKEEGEQKENSEQKVLNEERSDKEQSYKQEETNEPSEKIEGNREQSSPSEDKEEFEKDQAAFPGSKQSKPVKIGPHEGEQEDVSEVLYAHVNSSTSRASVSGNSRRASVASNFSTLTVDNGQIFKKGFEAILRSKDAKKMENLRTAVQKASDVLTHPAANNTKVIFESLKLVCEVGSNSSKAIAIDLFVKLFDNGKFDENFDKGELTDSAVDIIASCFEGEGTDTEVEMQILRALMHCVLLMPCHGASLLKAIRQIYNIFIFSLNARNQAVAQGILTQAMGSIFLRLNDIKLSAKSSDTYSDNPKSPTNLKTPFSDTKNEDFLNDKKEGKLTLENLEKFNDDSYDIDRVEEANKASEEDDDLAVKDAFLVFRAMCKLSVKALDTDSLEMRSHGVRSKLLSLHIIHTVLKEHIELFLSNDVVLLSTNPNDHTTLVNAIRQYLCLSLSRNAASPLAPVFELSLEIFWLIISNLRAEFKREIPVFWDEIYFPVAEMKTSTPHQKRYLLSIIERLCNDSRCILEFYLNYDCDSGMPNICERIIEYLTRLSLLHVDVTPQQKQLFLDNRTKEISVYDIAKISNLASNTMPSKPPEPDVYNYFPLEYSLKITSFSCNVAFLRSLYAWTQKSYTTALKSSLSNNSRNGSYLTTGRERQNTGESSSSTLNNQAGFSNGNSESFNDIDDPEQFENLKLRKKAFLEGIKQFNQKPKKGLKYFLDSHFISSNDPGEIANFLLETDGLDKATIGEFLGEGDQANVAIMHAFIDKMDFTSKDFVSSLRTFLQAFRLPGEAQKIDRFMLKFAERYIKGNPTVFSNADTAYVLAYSVILLNTDLHSPQIKNRMSVDSFIMNNAGIDDGKDLPREFLVAIYDEIKNDEIKLQSEQHAALLSTDFSTNTSSIGFFGGRDLNREAYMHASKEMSTKTEKLVRNLGKKLKDSSSGVFYPASHVHHVKYIFDTLWMSILAALTSPFKEYDDDFIIKTCLDGIKISIKIACMFDLDYARKSFVGALVQFQNLNNYEEIKIKNVSAVELMLDLASCQNSKLKSSWIEILTSISQLERLQLIAQGVDQYSIPDVSAAKLVNRGSVDSSSISNSTSFLSLFYAASPSTKSASSKYYNQQLSPEVAQLLTRTELEVAIDKVFTNSASLSGEDIVDFVKALCQVSAEEIESSGQSAHPRMFCLQKVVDVAYYNMSRIRLEWSHLWALIAETFNKAGSHSNLAIVFFALDSLRQLSMRFLEIEELSYFKFQKEFLKPFENIMKVNKSAEVKDMILECINNMILAKGLSIKSGWKTILGVLSVAAHDNREIIVYKAFRMATWLNQEYEVEVRSQESFPDLVYCFTELSKNERFQKISLLSLEVLLKLMLQIVNVTLDESKKTAKIEHEGTGVVKIDSERLEKLWFPILFGLYDIIMTGEELEVRSRALKFLFDCLMKYGKHFDDAFWDYVCHKTLFPIFIILENRWQLKNTNEDGALSVWLSTTLIQALRNMITLFTTYYQPLRRLLDEYLNLLTSCICQENETIARIGRSCLLSLVVDNSENFSDEDWSKISKAFNRLFKLTTADALFSGDPLLTRSNSNLVDKEESDVGFDTERPERENRLGSFVNHANLLDSETRLVKSKEKSSIVVKCVLQLLMVETLAELFGNSKFYNAVPFQYLFELANCLKESYNFAKTFNDDYDLRMRLWNAGVIERLPNLLKQESTTAAVYINIMFRIYCDEGKVKPENKTIVTDSVVPLCTSIVERVCALDEASQQRHIASWKAVILEIYHGYVELDDSDFQPFAPELYKLTIGLLSKPLTPDLRALVKLFLLRVGDTFVSKK